VIFPLRASVPLCLSAQYICVSFEERYIAAAVMADKNVGYCAVGQEDRIFERQGSHGQLVATGSGCPSSGSFHR